MLLTSSEDVSPFQIQPGIVEELYHARALSSPGTGPRGISPYLKKNAGKEKAHTEV